MLLNFHLIKGNGSRRMDKGVDGLILGEPKSLERPIVPNYTSL